MAAVSAVLLSAGTPATAQRSLGIDVSAYQGNLSATAWATLKRATNAQGRANHDNIHVRGYKEEGTITTAFDMTVLNDLDRFHLVMDAIDRLPQTGEKGVCLKQQLQDKLIEHKEYINKNGEDLPEIRNWKWGGPEAGKLG